MSVCPIDADVAVGVVTKVRTYGKRQLCCHEIVGSDFLVLARPAVRGRSVRARQWVQVTLHQIKHDIARSRRRVHVDGRTSVDER